MKKIFVLSFLMLLPIQASADAVEIDGIYYNLISKVKSAEVTSNPNKYSGNVIIPEKVKYESTEYSVTSIGTSAFRDCSGLTTITIPNSVTSIGSEAFVGCSGLTSIKVESGNTKYDSRDNCNAIIETISNTLISGCKNTTIPNSVTSIGNSAFRDCSGLTSINIPICVTSIGNYAFDGCSGLTSITIPISVTSIGNYAFSGCSGLTSITIPNSVSSIGQSAFVPCSGLNSIKVESENKKYDSRGNCNAIIETISNTLIAGCKNTTIPNSVTSIGNSAFYDCSGLTSIAIPNSVTSIGNQAFLKCSGLISITIPNSVTSIGSSTFFDCSGLLDVFCYAENVPKTGGLAFSSSNIENATLHVPASSVGAYKATSPWKRFKEIVAIVEGETETGVYATNADGVIIYYKYINSGKDLELTSNPYGNYSGVVRIPEKVTFAGNTMSVTSIGDYAFNNCSGLTSITIPNSVKSIGQCAFRFCGGLTSVTIGNNVTSIEVWAFAGCSGLTSITIPNSTRYIGGGVFSDCSGLTSVTIGNNVTSIGEYAFQNCSGLLDMFCYAENVPKTGNLVFFLSNIASATLHVPASSVSTYKATDPWKYFNKIVAIDGGTSETSKCSLPKISYQNGKLSFSCDTEGVDFISEIKDTDIKTNYTKDVDLTVTYFVSVYATKSGYDNSDVATATLCWIDVDPKTEGITNGVANVRAMPVMIQNNDNVLNITGAPEGSMISVYDLSGQMVGSAKAGSESTNISTSLRSGDVGIVKIGERSVKVIIK